MLIFRHDLALAVMAGEKTATRRALSNNPRSPWWRGKCAHEPGTRHAVCPGRGKPNIGHVVLDDVQLVRLGTISDDGARAEGFPDAAAFKAGWIEINGAWMPRQRVWLLTFHVAPPEPDPQQTLEFASAPPNRTEQNGAAR